MFYQELINYLVDWLKCRRWRRMLWFSLPLACVLIAMTGLIGFGYFGRSSQEVVRDYLELAEQEMAATAASDEAEMAKLTDINELPTPLASAADMALEAAEEDSAQARLFDDAGRVSAYAAMLLRRVLQTEEVNNRAAFVLAVDLGKNGRVGTARQLMRKIAPLELDQRRKSHGLSAGHAWLALESMRRRSNLTPQEREALLRDLELAMAWEDVTDDLIREYAQLLTDNGDAKKAMRLLREHLPRFAELDMDLLEIAWRAGDERELSDSTALAKKRLSELIAADEASAEDYADYASVLLSTTDFDKAIENSQEGLKRLPAELSSTDDQLTQQKLRRVLSECLRFKYKASISSAGGGVSVNLDLLDASLRADPTNPNTIAEVANLVAQGSQATPEMLAALRKSLAEGTATAITHLILADWWIGQGNSKRAIPHLELALRRAPDNPVALNNLSFALALNDEGQLPRALSLINQALAIAGSSPDMLETKAQILLKKRDLAGAILCLEDAVRLDGNRVEIRQELASAYTQLGMSDLAAQQLQRIQELQMQTSGE
ncbi:MAG: hypothetical protein NXI32_25685 [bacterium]|nr:hypothetical protein [bacterium]